MKRWEVVNASVLEPFAVAVRFAPRYPSAVERSRPVSGRVAALDGVRAISILFVVLGHAARTTPSSKMRWLLETFGDAELGVSAFFVLSGYLITRLLLIETEKTGRISLRGFYWRRAFRILPAFAFFLGTLAALRAMRLIEFSNGELLAAGLFIWNYVPWTASWWLGHTWSLSVEEQFYLFWPASLRYLGSERARRAAIALIVLTPIVRIASYFAFPSFRGRIPIMAHTRIDTLMFGCLLALSLDRGLLAPLANRWVKRALPYAAAIILVVHSICARAFSGRYLLTVGFTIEGAALSAIIYSITTNQTSLMTRLLSLGPLALVGRLSYSLYLWQQLFLTPDNHSVISGWPLNLVGAITIASASYGAIEQPALRLGRRLSKRAAI